MNYSSELQSSIIVEENIWSLIMEENKRMIIKNIRNALIVSRMFLNEGLMTYVCINNEGDCWTTTIPQSKRTLPDSLYKSFQVTGVASLNEKELLTEEEICQFNKKALSLLNKSIQNQKQIERRGHYAAAI